MERVCKIVPGKLKLPISFSKITKRIFQNRISISPVLKFLFLKIPFLIFEIFKTKNRRKIFKSEILKFRFSIFLFSIFDFPFSALLLFLFSFPTLIFFRSLFFPFLNHKNFKSRKNQRGQSQSNFHNHFSAFIFAKLKKMIAGRLVSFLCNSTATGSTGLDAW